MPKDLWAEVVNVERFEGGRHHGSGAAARIEHGMGDGSGAEARVGP